MAFSLHATLNSIINYICIVDAYSNGHVIYNITGMWARDVFEGRSLSAGLHGKMPTSLTCHPICARSGLSIKCRCLVLSCLCSQLQDYMAVVRQPNNFCNDRGCILINCHGTCMNYFTEFIKDEWYLLSTQAVVKIYKSLLTFCANSIFLK